MYKYFSSNGTSLVPGAIGVKGRPALAAAATTKALLLRRLYSERP